MRHLAILTLAGAALLSACDQEPAAGPEAAEPTENASVNTAEAPAATLPAAVDAEMAKTVMHDRHENYEEIGDAMKLITRELKSDSPDLAQVRQGADTIASLAPQVPGWFPAGTGPDAGKTHAKAIIWEQPADFLAKAQAFEEEAADFQAAAQGSDLAAIRAAHGELGKSCKACHDIYREKD